MDTTQANTPPAADPAPPLVEAARQALRQVMDPEVGMNILDLGLVYAIVVDGNTLRIDLTMTSQACPMGDMIQEEARAALIAVLPPTVHVELRLVWAPPWGPERMSATARQRFGW